MNRVAVYLGILVLLFGGAFALGAVFAGGDEEAQHGPQTTEETHAEGGHADEAGGSHGEAARGPGGADTHGLKLELEASSLRAGQAGELGLKVLDAGGDPIERFEVEHTKQMHLILVSEDLRQFAHVHPKVGRGGAWRTEVELLQPGEYRVIADVRHEGRKLALTADLEVGGEPRVVGRPVDEARFTEQKLRAGQPTTLRFTAPGETEQYLGAAGHLVVLSEGELEYLHVHPHDDELAFEAAFPKPGKYVMFLEYRRDGKVHTARFPVSVT